MIRWSLPIALIAAGCTGGEPMFEGYAAEHAHAVEELRALNEAHSAAVVAETDPARIRGLELEHRSAMNGPLGNMGIAIDQMMRCRQTCCTDRARMMDGMERELDTHVARMHGAASLQELRDEEGRHQLRMSGDMAMMDHDHEQMQHMMGMHSDMDCN